MRLKTKILKNLISVLCAATISTSSVAPSVGAFRGAANAKADVVSSVGNANKFLEKLKDRIDKMLQKTYGEAEKYVNTMNYDDQLKSSEVASYLEMIKQRVNEFDEIVINDSKLAENITNELVGGLWNDEYSEVNIGNVDEYKKLLKEYFELAVNMNTKLDSIKSMIEKPKKQQAETENEYNKIKQEFVEKNRAFSDWKKEDERRAQVYEKSKVKTTRLEVINLYKKLGKEYNFEKAEEFIKLAKKAMEEMEQFKAEYEKNGNEYDKIKSEFLNTNNDFHNWKEKDKRITQVYKNSEVRTIRLEAINLHNELDEEFNFEKAEKFITLAKKAMEEMKKFKAEYEKNQEQINGKLTLKQFESLLAGNQNVDNEMEIANQKVKVFETCGVHVITTLKNIYDYIDGKREGFIKGFPNVISNFLAQGGKTDRIFKIKDSGRAGEALDSSDFKGFLGTNKIGMHRINFFEFFGAKEAARDSNKTEDDVLQEQKAKWVEEIKKFLRSYMKGKDFAPVANVSGGHWQLLAQYDEQTDRVVRLDSSPAKAEWVSLDTVAKNFVRCDSLGNGIYAFNFEMPIFTRTEGFQDYNVDGVNEFTLQKQQELIKSIG